MRVWGIHLIRMMNMISGGMQPHLLMQVQLIAQTRHKGHPECLLVPCPQFACFIDACNDDAFGDRICET